ncbi:hypothetical protein XENORESO_021678 [Xenotaenia resolanae]|uniref:Uncharacterized protein n=1 Tax=Xenotaenia resolanae TaxID=208358 RepID=A0ABV0X5U1_9TELE
MCTYWILPLLLHSDKGICQADEQSELKRCVMHAWKELTSCREAERRMLYRGRGRTEGEEEEGTTSRTLGEDYHNHCSCPHQGENTSDEDGFRSATRILKQ